MRNKFEDEFKNTMNTLRFSPEDKHRMTKNLLQYEEWKEQRKDIRMNKSTLPKAAAIAAACLLLTGVTVFAASKIVIYTASSNGSYDYSSVEEMNDASSTTDDKQNIEFPDFPEVLGDYTFDGGNTVYVSGKDNANNTVDNRKDLRAVYKDPTGSAVNLLMSAGEPDEDDRTHTEIRTIGGITVTYDYDEYLILPAEDEPLPQNVQERMDTDDHFFVSYGSSEAETKYFSSLSFVKDGISYYISSMDEITAEDLFDMAEDLICK